MPCSRVRLLEGESGKRVEAAVEQQTIGESQQERGERIGWDLLQLAVGDANLDPSAEALAAALHDFGESRAHRLFGHHRRPEVRANLDMGRILTLCERSAGESTQSLGTSEHLSVQLIEDLVNHAGVFFQERKQQRLLAVEVTVESAFAQTRFRTYVVDRRIAVALAGSTPPGALDELLAALIPNRLRNARH